MERQNRRWRALRKEWHGVQKETKFAGQPHVPFKNWLVVMAKKWNVKQKKRRLLGNRVVRNNPYVFMYDQKTKYQRALKRRYSYVKIFASSRSAVYGNKLTRNLLVSEGKVWFNSAVRLAIVSRFFKQFLLGKQRIKKRRFLKNTKRLWFKQKVSSLLPNGWLAKRVLHNIRYRAGWIAGTRTQRIVSEDKKSFLIKKNIRHFQTFFNSIRWQKNSRVVSLRKMLKTLPLRIALLKVRLLRQLRTLKRSFKRVKQNKQVSRSRSVCSRLPLTKDKEKTNKQNNSRLGSTRPIPKLVNTFQKKKEIEVNSRCLKTSDFWVGRL